MRASVSVSVRACGYVFACVLYVCALRVRALRARACHVSIRALERVLYVIEGFDA